MSPRKPLVVGNWKMHGDRVSSGKLLSALAAGVGASLGAKVGVAVCPPYPYLEQARVALAGTPVELGGQDVSSFDNGAYTGEVSATMLLDLGCRWAIVGHSERRALLAEGDELVAAKADRALASGLSVIVCVGETLAEREQGDTEAVLARQVGALAEVAAKADAQRFVVAYEPVWAIGTGKTASTEQAQAAHAFIRARLGATGFAAAADTRVLYGGSVKPANAGSLFAMPDIDGGLIGGASLSADDFIAIAVAAANAQG